MPAIWVQCLRPDLSWSDMASREGVPVWAVGSPAQGAVPWAVLGGGKVTVAVLDPERLLLGKSPSACCRKWGCSSGGGAVSLCRDHVVGPRAPQASLRGSRVLAECRSRGRRGYIGEDQLPPGSPPSAARVAAACARARPCSRATLSPKDRAVSHSMSSGRHSSFPVCPSPQQVRSHPLTQSLAGRTWRGPRHLGTRGGAVRTGPGSLGMARTP